MIFDLLGITVLFLLIGLASYGLTTLIERHASWLLPPQDKPVKWFLADDELEEGENDELFNIPTFK